MNFFDISSLGSSVLMILYRIVLAKFNASAITW